MSALWDRIAIDPAGSFLTPIVGQVHRGRFQHLPQPMDCPTRLYDNEGSRSVVHDQEGFNRWPQEFTVAKHDKYESFVEHPRYGTGPRLTGLNPWPVFGRFFHWHSPIGSRIPSTAIEADLEHQTPATVAVTHYFDVQRICRDCSRPFLFFAAEQKHWYEELGFGLDSDCVRCFPCRRQQQGIARGRERYEELSHVPDRTSLENLEMAEICLTLVLGGIFHRRQLERVRMLLNRTQDQLGASSRYQLLVAKLAEND